MSMKKALAWIAAIGLAWALVLGVAQCALAAWTKPYTVTGTTGRYDAFMYHEWDVDEIFTDLNLLKSTFYGASAPASPDTGQLWIDSDDGRLYWYTGATWAGWSATALPTGVTTHATDATLNDFLLGQFNNIRLESRPPGHTDAMIIYDATRGPACLVIDGDMRCVTSNLITPPFAGAAGGRYIWAVPTAGVSTFTIQSDTSATVAPVAGARLIGWAHWSGSAVTPQSVGAFGRSPRQVISEDDILFDAAQSVSNLAYTAPVHSGGSYSVPVTHGPYAILRARMAWPSVDISNLGGDGHATVHYAFTVGGLFYECAQVTIPSATRIDPVTCEASLPLSTSLAEDVTVSPVWKLDAGDVGATPATHAAHGNLTVTEYDAEIVSQ